MSEALRFTVDEGVATLTIDHPERHNALDPTILRDLRTALATIRDDASVHVVVLRGAGGRSFSTGVDLDFAREARILEDGSAGFRFTALIRDTLVELETLAVPTIAAVDGYALAGGLELMLACDLAVCTDRSRLGDQHAAYDLLPGAGASQRLPRRIGVQPALELMFTGRHVDGPEAARLGLVLRSVSPDTLDDAVREITDRLRSTSRAALTAMKSMVTRGIQLPLRDGLDLERLLAQEYFVGQRDAVDGLDTFAARDRAPGTRES